MKTVKVYRCRCGEDVYEDDDVCVSCRQPTDKSKLREVEVAEVVRETWPRYIPKPPLGPRRRLSNEALTAVEWYEKTLALVYKEGYEAGRADDSPEERKPAAAGEGGAR